MSKELGVRVVRQDISAVVKSDFSPRYHPFEEYIGGLPAWDGVNERDELLVCRRAKEPAKGTLDLPGGFCDMYESAEEGVAREVREETGCEVTHAQFLFTLPNTYLYCGFLVHTIDLFFLCRIDSHCDLVAHDDVAECMWIPFNEIEPEAFGLASVRKGIERILSSR